MTPIRMVPPKDMHNPMPGDPNTLRETPTLIMEAFRARPDSVCVRDGLAGWGGRTRNSASGICVPAGFTAVVPYEEGRLCTRLLAFGTRSAATLCAPR